MNIEQTRLTRKFMTILTFFVSLQEAAEHNQFQLQTDVKTLFLSWYIAANKELLNEVKTANIVCPNYRFPYEKNSEYIQRIRVLTLTPKS